MLRFVVRSTCYSVVHNKRFAFSDALLLLLCVCVFCLFILFFHNYFVVIFPMIFFLAQSFSFRCCFVCTNFVLVAPSAEPGSVSKKVLKR